MHEASVRRSVPLMIAHCWRFDDEARWLVGDPLAKGEVIEPANPTTVAPRLSIVRPTSELSLPSATEVATVTPSETSAPAVELFDADLFSGADELDAPVADDADFEPEPAGDEPVAYSDFDNIDEPAEPPTRGNRLPSWDEILFDTPPESN